MTHSYQAVVHVDPLPCPRPRIALRGRFPTAYYPASYKKWREAFAKELPDVEHRFTTPVTLAVEFVIKRPKSTKLDTPKGDIDNYMKSVMDALTDHGVWEDDKQVDFVAATKRFTNPGETAFIHFSVNESSCQSSKS